MPKAFKNDRCEVISSNVQLIPQDQGTIVLSVKVPLTKSVRKRKQLTLDGYTKKKGVVAATSSAFIAAADNVATCSSSVPSVDAVSSIAMHNALNKYDIGNFFSLDGLTNEDRYDFLVNVWRPESSFVFPTNLSGRTFQYRWLAEFPWLTYSKVCDGAFCINCVLFGNANESSYGVHILTHLFKSPFCGWPKALQKFRNHAQKSHVHKSSSIKALQFRLNFESKAKPIDVQLNTIANERIEKNRKKLNPIVQAIILCGRQNIALRGHRDDSKHYEDDKANPGNLQEILKFLGRCGENALFDEHLQSAPKSATYRSKTTQNELIKICGDLIVAKICTEIRRAKYFSVLADEATDVSNIEQMPIVVRFVDVGANIREELLGFSQCSEGMTGEAISNTILESVKDFGLDMSFCRGQGYDGAANMSGKCAGAAARITRQFPKAPYVHCGSHLLNLCVASACGIQVVRNMMGHVRVVSDFFNNSPKRFKVLSETIKELFPNARHNRLIDVCRTRWIARLDGLDVFAEVLAAVVRSLDVMRLNVDRSWNSDSVRDASGLFHATLDFQFIVVLIIVSRSLEVTRPLTKQLQTVSFDVVAANEKISLLYASLCNLREGIGNVHGKWFEEAESLTDSVGVVPSRPRTTQKQTHRANTPADSVSQYYERVVTLPFLDHITSQIHTRFSKSNVISLDGFYAFPAKVVSHVDWKAKVVNFLNHYRDDLPEPRYIETELGMWEEYWQQSVDSCPSTLADLLPKIDKLTFPNLYTALQILATTPVTTCTCERSVSVLRRLKTYLRNTMTQSRLNGLALLNVHREVELDVDEVIDCFARKHRRRMQLVDIFNSDPGDDDSFHEPSASATEIL